MLKKLLMCLSLTLWSSVNLLPAAFAQPAAPQKVTSVEGITEYRLANGLKLLVFPDPAASTITVNMTYLVGSRQEGAGEGGMAHLLEHMLFKGSPRHTNIPQELTEHGARPNGTTSWDRTNYFETFQASDENLRWALDLEADRMVNSFIRGSDLASEFSVVRSEFEAGENRPASVLFQQTMGAAYRAHSYGRPVIGNRSDVEHVPVESLQVFYRKYYQPDNAVLTVAGRVDEAQIVTLVQQYFGAIPKPTRVLSPTWTIEPAQDGERQVAVRRVGDVRLLIAMYHVPEGASADDAPLDVLATLLGDAPSGRLYRALVDSRLATQVSARTLSLHDPGLFYASAVLGGAADEEAARKALLDTLEQAAATPPTVAEVDRARTRLLNQLDQTLRDSTRVGLVLSDAIAQGDWRLLFKSRDRLRAVTPADVQRVAAAYLKPSNRTLGAFVPTAKPDRAEVPAKVDVAALLEGYKGDPTMAAGEAFDPSPANIESRTRRYATPAGAKVALLAKKTRGAAVRATLRLHFGTLQALQGQSPAAEMAGAMLMRGTQKHTRQQLQDELDRLQARMSVGGDADGASVTIETTRDRLPEVLKLAAEVLREPSFPADEFETLRRQWLTGLEASRSDPSTLASLRLDRALYDFPRADPRHRATLAEQIEDAQGVKLEDARAFHQRFYGASNAEIAIVGDFDPAPVQAALDAGFGSWRSPQPYAPVLEGFERRAAVNERIETPDKANANFLAAERIELRSDDADYPTLVLGNYLLGGGFLNSRLATRIRVKDGLSYGVGSRLTASSEERNGRFQVSAIAAPQNVAKVEAAMREELARALKDGFTAEEVAAAQAGWLQAQQVNRAGDAALASLLASRDHEGRTLAWDAGFEARVKAATPQSVGEAMRRHLDPSRLSIVKAGDFSKVAAP